MTMKESARGRCHDRRATVSTHERDTRIISGGWTRAQCRAIELALGGGFVALAALEVLFGW